MCYHRVLWLYEIISTKEFLQILKLSVNTGYQYYPKTVSWVCLSEEIIRLTMSFGRPGGVSSWDQVKWLNTHCALLSSLLRQGSTGVLFSNVTCKVHRGKRHQKEVLPKPTGRAGACAETPCRQGLWREEQTGTVWWGRGTWKSRLDRHRDDAHDDAHCQDAGVSPAVTDTEVCSAVKASGGHAFRGDTTQVPGWANQR